MYMLSCFDPIPQWLTHPVDIPFPKTHLTHTGGQAEQLQGLHYTAALTGLCLYGHWGVHRPSANLPLDAPSGKETNDTEYLQTEVEWDEFGLSVV